jgi:hypothetical protein
MRSPAQEGAAALGKGRSFAGGDGLFHRTTAHRGGAACTGAVVLACLSKIRRSMRSIIRSSCRNRCGSIGKIEGEMARCFNCGVQGAGKGERVGIFVPGALNKA